MQHLTDYLQTLDLPPFLLTEESGNIRVYFVTDLPIFKQGSYKDRQGDEESYDLANLAKAKVIYIGVSGKRVTKQTARKIYVGDSSIPATIMQLVKSAQEREAFDYPLLKLVSKLSKEDPTRVNKRLKQHIHESARFEHRSEAVDYAEILRENFMPQLRRKVKNDFIKQLAELDLDAEIQAKKERGGKKKNEVEQTPPISRIEAHADFLANRSDEDVF